MSDELFGGYVDDTQSKTAFSFGLNQGAKLIKFEHNPAIGFKNGNTANGIEVEIEINGMVVDSIIYRPEATYANGEVKEKDRFNKEKNSALQKILHIAKCFASKAEIMEAIAGVPVPFGEYVTNVKSVWEENWQDKKLDVFYQYQWQQKETADRKYLELPKNTKQGAFLIPTVIGNFRKVLIDEKGNAKDVDGNNIGKVSGKTLTTSSGKTFTLDNKKVALCYIDVETQTVHPFSKTTWFMENGWGQADDGADANLSRWS